MVINERCINMLSILNETNELTLKKLSEKFKVHVRTIRYDIDNINYILGMHKLDLIKKGEKGVVTINLKNNEINKIINDFSGIFSENRRKYLKIKLFSKDVINLTKEAKYLSISRTTLKKDLSIIKNEFLKNSINLKEISSKEIKIIGNEKKIIENLEKEMLEVVEKKFINQPSLIKNIIRDIVGEISPDALKSKVKGILGKGYNENYYTRVLCKLAAINTRHKLENKRKYNTDEIMEFVNLELIERIIKNEKDKKNRIVEIKIILKNIMTELYLEYREDLVDNLILEIEGSGQNKIVSEKLRDTNFYKKFLEKIKNTKLINKDIQSIFYIFYNSLLFQNNENFNKMKILFISDEIESVKNIVVQKLKQIFRFQEIDEISSHIFEIFGCEEDYDLIITSENISNISEIPLYKINKLPSEENLIDLKFLILKNIGD